MYFLLSLKGLLYKSEEFFSTWIFFWPHTNRNHQWLHFCRVFASFSFPLCEVGFLYVCLYSSVWSFYCFRLYTAVLWYSFVNATNR